MPHWLRRIVLVTAGGAALVPVVAYAADIPDPADVLFAFRIHDRDLAAGSLGFDISWPQCPPGMPIQTPVDVPAFAVVGVTGGKAYTANPCLADQYRWARRAKVQAQLYTNLNSMPRDYHDEHCVARDSSCSAYWYGFGAAEQAVAYARSQKADTDAWWLDIEIENYWSPDTALNARVIQGAVDYLHAVGKEVGIYSTPFQWHEIAGDFAPNLRTWTAGASDLADAQHRCNNPRYAFAGGQVKLVQYIDGNFDVNLAC